MAKHIAIIGAGISGLTAIKQCLDNDLIPICFEQNSFIGGIWKYEDVCEKNNDAYSSIYKNVITNTSKEMTTYSNFPIPALANLSKTFSSRK
ncbi:10355_t:CDS:2, partial [Dentiscutata heterogama]